MKARLLTGFRLNRSARFTANISPIRCAIIPPTKKCEAYDKKSEATPLLDGVML